MVGLTLVAQVQVSGIVELTLTTLARIEGLDSEGRNQTLEKFHELILTL